MSEALNLEKLPLLVIRNVVQYIAANYESEFGTDEYSLKLYLPLLHTCQLWRSAALSVLCAYSDIKLGDTISMSYSHRLNNRKKFLLNDADYDIYVKNLSLTFAIDSLCNNSILKPLQARLLRFANVTNLYLDVDLLEEHASSTDEIAAMFKKLAIKLDAAMPLLCKVALGIRTAPWFVSWTIHGKLIDVHQRLFACPRGALLPNIPVLVKERIQHFTDELSSLACTWDNQHPEFVHILCANSGSLLRLHICIESFEGLQNMFCFEDEAISFPSLRYLSLIKANESLVHTTPVKTNSVLFPHLYKLELQCIYPFSDDTLFRGNEQSLESVALAGSHIVLKAIYDCGVLRKHKSHVKWNVTIYNEQNNENFVKAFEVAMKISKSKYHAIGVLTAVCSNETNVLLETFSEKLQEANISTLETLSLTTSLQHLLNIVQAIPKLTRLSSYGVILGDELQNMNLQRLYQTLKQRYSSINTELKSLFLFNCEEERARTTVVCILFLILFCPHLEKIFFPYLPSDDVSIIYSQLAASREFAGLKRAIKPPINPILRYSCVDRFGEVTAIYLSRNEN